MSNKNGAAPPGTTPFFMLLNQKNGFRAAAAYFCPQQLPQKGKTKHQ
jgi:hypothetical protein